MGGQWQGTSQRQNAAGNRQPGRSRRKQEGPLKIPRAKAGVEERPTRREKASHATCAEGLGTSRGLCLSEGWANDLKKDALKGEDTIEDGCWTEEDDETFQQWYFGSDSCLVSSPPGLSDAFSEAG